jgi:hypothetical protein
MPARDCALAALAMSVNEDTDVITDMDISIEIKILIGFLWYPLSYLLISPLNPAPLPQYLNKGKTGSQCKFYLSSDTGEYQGKPGIIKQRLPLSNRRG